MIADAPIRERRKPARGWRGWRGPTEQKPFPSLGWLFLDWTYAHLPSPNDEQAPLVYTDEQARRIVRWFELHPISGDFVYDRLVFEEAKGWGKSPIAGTLDIGDMAGPVRFDGWDADGEPVGVPSGTAGSLPPWIQIAAFSEDQTANTYGALYGMLASRGGKVADDLRLDLGRTKVYHRDIPSAIIEPVTTSAGSRTGQRITKATIDETWLLTRANGGSKLVSTIRFNLSKSGGREVNTTNAPILGEGSVAEKANPERPSQGVLHYATRPSREPKPEDSDEVLAGHLAEVYRDVPWVPQRRLLKDVRDPETKWEDALRLFFNTRSSGESKAAEAKAWDLLADPHDIPAGTRIGIGFDGSTSHDATVLRGCTEDGYSFVIGRWSRPSGAMHWRVPRDEVDARVAEAFATWSVGRMLADPPGWYTEVESWQELYGEVVEAFDTNQARRMSPEIDRWRTAIDTGAHTHDGDEFCSAQVKDTLLRKVRLADVEDDRTMYMLEKGPLGNDATVADILAYTAAMTMDAEEPEPEEPLVAWR